MKTNKFHDDNAWKNNFIHEREVQNTFIQKYLDKGYQATHGFTNFTFPKVIDWLGTLPINQHGGVMEIGVHGGTCFILLNQTVSSGESVAIDVFHNQHLNVSKSGGYEETPEIDHLQLFLHNLEKFDYRHNGSNVRTIVNDSLILEPQDIHQGNRFKFIHVDGGHDPIHVMNDLRLAEKCVGREGVVILDDWLAPDWLGVTEGAIRYMMNQGTLVPFAASFRKLYFCTYSMVYEYRKFIHQSPYSIIEDSICGHTVCNFIEKNYHK